MPIPNRGTIEPLAPQRVHFGFTSDEELWDLFVRAKQLLWHKFPHGRMEDIFRQALLDLLEKRDPQRKVSPRKSNSGADRGTGGQQRYIPTSIRADVWKRDGGQCTFTTSDGVRCCEKTGLEYDHIVPFARGGASDDPDNIRMLCRAHNQLLAVEEFGEAAVRPRAGPNA